MTAVESPHQFNRGAYYLLILLLALPGPLEAAQKRSQAVVREFIRLVPCPVAGPGSCFQKGFEADHRWPICAYGADAVWNLQWLSIEEHDRKTVLDLRACAMFRAVR